MLIILNIMKSSVYLKNKLLCGFLLALIIFLIIDIQDGSLDLPVLIFHNLGNFLNYLNNLKLTNSVYQVLFIKLLMDILCLYIFNFNFAILFNIVIQLLNEWIYLFTTLNTSIKFKLHIFSRITFNKTNVTTIQAYTTLP